MRSQALKIPANIHKQQGRKNMTCLKNKLIWLLIWLVIISPVFRYILNVSLLDLSFFYQTSILVVIKWHLGSRFYETNNLIGFSSLMFYILWSQTRFQIYLNLSLKVYFERDQSLEYLMQSETSIIRTKIP